MKIGWGKQNSNSSEALSFTFWSNQDSCFVFQDEAVPDSSPAMGGVDMLNNNFYASSDNEVTI